jgi:hypothetical protein
LQLSEICVERSDQIASNLPVADLIICEGKVFLHDPDWNISDNIYALGFEYSTCFNNYLKRMCRANTSAPRAWKV